VVTYLPSDPRFVGSNQAEDDGYLRVIKIRTMTSFGGDVKPLVPCHNILRHVKEPYECEEILSRQNSAAISSPIFSCFATTCLSW
jgi:hypothetical protein